MPLSDPSPQSSGSHCTHCHYPIVKVRFTDSLRDRRIWPTDKETPQMAPPETPQMPLFRPASANLYVLPSLVKVEPEVG